MQPNSTLALLSGIKLDSSYQNTIYFSDANEQASYFIGKSVRTFLNSQYRRKEDGIVMVEGNVANYESVNYLMFQNTNFSNRWFYAFVTSCEYVNDDTTMVHFTLDMFQTYMTYFKYESCFVEREHVMDDEVGHNLVAEPLTVNNIIMNSFEKTGMFTEYMAVIWFADADNPGSAGHYQNGIFNGLTLTNAPMNSPSAIMNIISALINDNRMEAIVSISAIPTAFFHPQNSPYTTKFSISRPTTVDGYTPRNKKLLTYPYCYLCVDNTKQVAEYRYERFLGNPTTLNFNITAVLNPNTSITLTPSYYEASGDVYVQRLVMNDFPQLACVGDSYKAYLAQSALPTVFNPLSLISSSQPSEANIGDLLPIAGGIGQGIATAALTGNVLATVGQGFSAYSNMVSLAQKANMPDQLIGSNGGSGVDGVATRNLDFYFKKMSVTREEATILDEFFDMYGYQVDRVKKPNINGRKNWNFVKTKLCNISGNIPDIARQTIISATNRGITFWKNGDNIGNYGLSNTVS